MARTLAWPRPLLPGVAAGGGGADGDAHDAPPTASAGFPGPAPVSRRDGLGAETEAGLCAPRSAAARDVTRGGA